jgi:hypothetical protein
MDASRVYAAWDILGEHLGKAANQIADEVGPDVLEWMIGNAREIDSFVKEQLSKEATVTTREDTDA